jgi:hypothetical protein
MEYEIELGKVLLRIESILQNARQFQFYFVVSGLKILGHVKPDNNLESHCTFTEIMLFNSYFEKTRDYIVLL